MKSFTIAHFVNDEQLPEKSKSWLDLVPAVVYDKFISKCLKTRGYQPSIRPFWSFFPKNITNKEMDDVVKCDTDKLLVGLL